MTKYFAVRIVLVVSLHLVLLWLATAPLSIPAEHDNRVWVQLVHREPSPIPIPEKLVAEPVSTPLPSKRARSPATSEPPPAPVAPAAQASIVETVEERALLADTKASTSAPPADVVQQALKAVAGIDRQLRSEHRQEFSAPPDTPHTRLAKGFAAAHAAVKPKWFEAARTELISAPNDPKRIYRITTGMGEYCLYYPDKGSIAANSDPRSGLAGFGQPTAAGCPIPF